MSPRKFLPKEAVARTRNWPSDTPSLVGSPRRYEAMAWPTAGSPGASESCWLLERFAHRNGTEVLLSSTVKILRFVNHGQDPGIVQVGSAAVGVNALWSCSAASQMVEISAPVETSMSILVSVPAHPRWKV